MFTNNSLDARKRMQHKTHPTHWRIDIWLLQHNAYLGTGFRCRDDTRADTLEGGSQNSAGGKAHMDVRGIVFKKPRYFATQDFVAIDRTE